MKIIELYWHNSNLKTCNLSCIFKGVKLLLMELKCICFHETLSWLFVSHHIFSCGYQQKVLYEDQEITELWCWAGIYSGFPKNTNFE